MSKRLFQHAFAQVLSVAVRAVTHLVVPAILIDALGGDRYGLWVLAGAFSLGGFYSLLDLGLQQATVKYAAEYRSAGDTDAMNGVVAFSQRAMLALGAFAAGLTGLLAYVGPERVFKIPPELHGVAGVLLALIAARTLLHFVFTTPAAVVRAADRIDVLRWSDIVAALAFALGAGLTAKLGGGLYELAGVEIAIALLRGAFNIVAARHFVAEVRFFAPVSREVRARIFAFVRGIVVVKFASLVFVSVDRAVIGAMLSTSVLTHYDVAYKPHQLAMQLLDVFAAAILPIAAVAHREAKHGELRRLLLSATRYTWALVAAACLVLACLAEPFLVTWVGPDYAVDAPYVRIFLLHLAFMAFVPVGQNVLYGMGEVRSIAHISVYAAIANLGLSVALAPVFGLGGVALGTLGSSLLSFVLHLRAFRQHVQVSPVQLLGDTLRAAALPLALGAGVLLGAMRVRPPAGWVELALYGGVTMGVMSIAFAAFGLDSSERAALRARLERGLGRKKPPATGG